MNPKCLFLIMFVLVPTVYSCVNFQAWSVPDGSLGAYPLSAQLWDNLGPSDTPTCSMDGYVSDDGYYHLNCVDSANVQAWFDASQYIGVAYYLRPGTNGVTFSFQVPPTDSSKWATCVYDCNGCFVPT
ncbi:unnamed protein product [Calypogeia fissa]